jgi:formylglycine-generating enzyme required for sulfatase activity
VNPGATFYIPTENEWYKAAYFSPVANFGSAGYYRIATQTNVDPANNIGSSYSAVNFFRGQFGYSVTQSTSYSFSQNYLTDVGAFTNAASYYGTFDQSGNVYEWNDLTGAAGSSRGVRGGSWANEFFPAESLSSSKRHTTDASTEAQQYGFRLASPVAVPEPSTWMMGLAGVACAGFQMIRRHKRARSHEHEKAADETGQDKLLKRQKTLRLTVDPFRG